MNKWIVYTEIHQFGKPVERWYYGTYDEQRADEVAYELDNDEEEGIWHCVCPLEDAEKYGILNLP